jgi:hypothetical protein
MLSGLIDYTLEAFLNTFTDTPLLTEPKFSDPFQ